MGWPPRCLVCKQEFFKSEHEWKQVGYDSHSVYSLCSKCWGSLDRYELTNILLHKILLELHK